MKALDGNVFCVTTNYQMITKIYSSVDMVEKYSFVYMQDKHFIRIIRSQSNQYILVVQSFPHFYPINCNIPCSVIFH